MPIVLGLVDAQEYAIQDDISKFITENQTGLGIVAVGIVAAAGGAIYGTDKKIGKIATFAGIGILALGAYTIFVKTGQAQGQPNAIVNSVIVR